MNLLTSTEILAWPQDEFGFSPIKQVLKNLEWSVNTARLDKDLTKGRSINQAGIR